MSLSSIINGIQDRANDLNNYQINNSMSLEEYDARKEHIDHLNFILSELRSIIGGYELPTKYTQSKLK